MVKRNREDDTEDVPKAKRGSNIEEEEDFEIKSQVFVQKPENQHDEEQNGENFDEDEDNVPYDGWYRVAGTIEYVKMKNFMCHAKLDYTPICRTNFLSGANGSGKSAILAALMFGLGGTARLSNRGSANRNFIRTNQPTASVEISLFNRGENSYKPVCIPEIRRSRFNNLRRDFLDTKI